jgi:opacity protein-like surface antigen
LNNVRWEEPRVIADRLIKALSVLTTCAIALTVALPSSAADGDDTDDISFYVEYSGGATYVPNQRVVGEKPTAPFIEGNTESKTGFNVGGSFGTRFYEYFRGEIQFTYRENETNKLSLKGQNTGASGHTGLMTVMANGYVDYDLGIGVVPYVGVGMGWGRLELDAKNKGTIDGGFDQTNIEGDDSVFAWSLMVGGSYPINEVLDVSLGYRYIATTDADVNSTIIDRGAGVGTNPPLNDPSTSVARRLETEYDAHEVVLGVRVNF